ncbi:hypothetical protein NUW58_g8567 [Xylaria curta]|uniref:Uncharacterized protein n=1 Tax=Xylaria curta TaxID=42375 RepID=A0ACC1N730_9PEZI|nr:hypothetical protein NUW58_g8567 [Xylaria curta]
MPAAACLGALCLRRITSRNSNDIFLAAHTKTQMHMQMQTQMPQAAIWLRPPPVVAYVVVGQVCSKSGYKGLTWHIVLVRCQSLVGTPCIKLDDLRSALLRIVSSACAVVGEFDMNRASLYWKIMYWLDYWFKLFGHELVSGDKED